MMGYIGVAMERLTIELTSATDGRTGGIRRGIKAVEDANCQYRQRPG